MNQDYYAVLAQKEYSDGVASIDFNDGAAVTTRYHVLVATGHKDEKDTGGDALRSVWAKRRQKVDLGALPDFLKPPMFNDFSCLPFGSFYIQFKFKLLKPYISRDDNAFYIVDNPIVREKVFHLPMVRSTAWKGSLYHALWQIGGCQNEELQEQQIKRMFGTANDEQPEEGKSGRLYFYPSFFTQTGMEVINPHDRKTRVGKNPILIESVPIGAEATFTLLYAPLDRVGKENDKTRNQVITDMKLVAEGMEALFTIYGFGAKTSSGFGLANDEVENGFLGLNWPGFVFPQAETNQVQKPEDAFLKYMDESGFIKSDFSGTGDYGLMSNSEYKGNAPSGGGSLSEFKAFRKWYCENGEQWQKSLKGNNSAINYPELSFDQLSQLVEVLRQMGGEV
jgi:CRISPR-associated protein Cmr2